MDQKSNCTSSETIWKMVSRQDFISTLCNCTQQQWMQEYNAHFNKGPTIFQNVYRSCSLNIVLEFYATTYITLTPDNVSQLRHYLSQTAEFMVQKLLWENFYSQSILTEVLTLCSAQELGLEIQMGNLTCDAYRSVKYSIFRRMSFSLRYTY